MACAIFSIPLGLLRLGRLGPGRRAVDQTQLLGVGVVEPRDLLVQDLEHGPSRKSMSFGIRCEGLESAGVGVDPRSGFSSLSAGFSRKALSVALS